MQPRLPCVISGWTLHNFTHQVTSSSSSAHKFVNKEFTTPSITCNSGGGIIWRKKTFCLHEQWSVEDGFNYCTIFPVISQILLCANYHNFELYYLTFRAFHNLVVLTLRIPLRVWVRAAMRLNIHHDISEFKICCNSPFEIIDLYCWPQLQHILVIFLGVLYQCKYEQFLNSRIPKTLYGNPLLILLTVRIRFFLLFTRLDRQTYFQKPSSTVNSKLCISDIRIIFFSFSTS